MEEISGQPTRDAGRRAIPSRLTTIRLQGYRSFRREEITFGDVTVLLGANGSGKSNLVSFFELLWFLSTGALQRYVVQRAGGSDSILYGGRRTTPQMCAEIEFADGDPADETQRTSTYRIRLADAAPDTLVFVEERVRYHASGFESPQDILLGAGHQECRLEEKAREGNRTCGVLVALLRNCRGYQFHDTSAQANIRKSRYLDDDSYLRSDAGNLAPYLHGMRSSRPDCYRRIVETVRLVFPAFGDFDLEPRTTRSREVLLNWRERGCPEYRLGPHQLSDGTLRFMALATLFLQPADSLPNVIIVDEPELGLHPYAIAVLAGMVRSVATKVQVVLATQSTRLVDEFDSSDIVVLEADGAEGTKRRPLDPISLAEWLDEYSLGELWEKNHFGGRP